MKKPFMPHFRIVLALVVMVPSFSISLSIFLVMLNKQYVDWLNGDAFTLLALNHMERILLFCIMAFVAGAILLLNTVYVLDKEREK